MSGKHSCTLESKDWKRKLPHKIIIGRQEPETIEHVALKLVSYLFFHRDRLQIGMNLHNDSIPFIPDLIQLDYELRPVLWVQCGECTVNKLNKLAVKVPEAEIWIVQPSIDAANNLLRAMAKAELRRKRYHLLALDREMFAEMTSLVRSRNDLLWVSAAMDPPEMHFDFNGMWFEMPFETLVF